MLVAPLIMDGPQACSRWARQPQPQLRHFKKPLVGPLPSPSSHSGRSEAPENSEMSPREKGNLGLPVLLTDGSTHLEQIVGSEWATVSQRTVICGIKSGAWRPEDAQDASVCVEGGRAKVTGADELFSTTQECCVLLCYDFAATLFSIWSLKVGDGGGIFSCALFFSRQMVRGETRMCWRGGFDRNEKRAPTFSHNPLALVCGK